MRFSHRWEGLACALLFAAAASATSVPRLSFEELTDHSEVIASGKITRIWADWDAPRRYIWTHYELAVASAYKGKPGAMVVISEPGGIVGGIGMSIEGSPAYKVGDSVLVFLERVPNGYLRTTGWGQGQYRVDRGGNIHASESLRGVNVVSAGTASPAALSLTTLEGRSLSDIAARVGARAAAHAGETR